ncbi:4-hydroxy-tetrahydrodipicolinate synthase [Burkholderia ubonensis]|uniref:4-hydroxy-tetrahydrodipicolinate synthase n=1 Tax=Burkholderia ubonensis subsp. mesacidophila TaxID=265293 RepID=A0A2A4FDV5_9BURK|nr:4-hydroxy-tetrahydrodipicolinate synthase [Burkholderia ubonensis]PCE30850.1 4-hydroxy-tetrahydrodipicolinate synthase [Burkholderia ubonensis subsp. mesacidophila]
MNVVQGSLVALATPMSGAGQIDYEALAEIIEQHVAAGTAALVVAGTTGESATMSAQEQAHLVQHVVDRCRGRMPVVAGVGANSTHEAIELSQMARDAGASSGLSVVPYYVRPNQEGMRRHFETVAVATDFPQILYNIPSRTGADMHDATVVALAKDPRIVGIKDATSDLARAARLFEQLPPGFGCYSGDDATTLAYMLLGGHGTISVAANVAPRAMARLCSLALDGEVGAARALNAKLLPLYEALSIDTNPIPVKYMLARLGWMPDGIRLPLVPLAADKRARVDAILAELAQWCDDVADAGARSKRSAS